MGIRGNQYDQDKVFFLGIGAAKSGTSWLYDYLITHPKVAAGPIKEMHVLNSPGNAGYIRAVRGLPWHRFAGRKWLRENLRKAWFRANWKRYFSAYETRFVEGFQATGEISTSYMSISSETLELVQTKFAEHNVRSVGILLLRDPVERLISDIRFHKRLSQENRYAVEQIDTLETLLSDQLETKASKLNAEYQHSINTLKRVFSKNDLIIELYETLFQQDTLDRICNRLNLEPLQGDLEKLVNATASKETISDDIRALAASLLKDSYVTAAQHFGQDQIRAHWPNAVYVLT